MYPDEFDFPPEAPRHRLRPFVIVAVALLLLGMLFFTLTGDAGKGGGSGGGSGSGSGIGSGVGSGSGSGSGGGSGSGEAMGNGSAISGASSENGGGAGSGAASVPDPAAGVSGTGEYAGESTAAAAGSKQEISTAVPKVLQKELFPVGAATPAPDSSRGGDVGGGGGGGFYGVEVRPENRILFLIDVSGSMQALTPEKISRLAVMKRELLQAVRNASNAAREAPRLSRGTYQILAFSDTIQVFDRLLFRSSASDKLLQRSVDALNAGGGTSLKTCWQQALEIIRKDRIDTVYLLTDGEPTDCDADTLLAYLETLPSELTVHCIAVGRDSALLEEIARRHHGRYVTRM